MHLPPPNGDDYCFLILVGNPTRACGVFDVLFCDVWLCVFVSDFYAWRGCLYVSVGVVCLLCSSYCAGGFRPPFNLPMAHKLLLPSAAIFSATPCVSPEATHVYRYLLPHMCSPEAAYVFLICLLGPTLVLACAPLHLVCIPSSYALISVP